VAVSGGVVVVVAGRVVVVGAGAVVVVAGRDVVVGAGAVVVGAGRVVVVGAGAVVVVAGRVVVVRTGAVVVVAGRVVVVGAGAVVVVGRVVVVRTGAVVVGAGRVVVGRRAVVVVGRGRVAGGVRTVVVVPGTAAATGDRRSAVGVRGNATASAARPARRRDRSSPNPVGLRPLDPTSGTATAQSSLLRLNCPDGASRGRLHRWAQRPPAHRTEQGGRSVSPTPLSGRRRPAVVQRLDQGVGQHLRRPAADPEPLDLIASEEARARAGATNAPRSARSSPSSCSSANRRSLRRRHLAASSSIGGLDVQG